MIEPWLIAQSTLSVAANRQPSVLVVDCGVARTMSNVSQYKYCGLSVRHYDTTAMCESDEMRIQVIQGHSQASIKKL